MKLPFKTVRFITSALSPEEWPLLKTPQGSPLPEIALVGRSNVGKSSLINALCNQSIAKTSSTPGKTQRINFFLVDETLLLVDLPGYGYAKAPSSLVQEWSYSLHTYFQTRSSLRLLLLLIDSRRGPSQEDLSIVAWAEKRSLPLLPIFTKIDKFSSPPPLPLPHSVAFSIYHKPSIYSLKRNIQTRILS